MRIFILTFVDSNYTGINSKILTQKNAFINLGHECFVGFFEPASDDNIAYVINGREVHQYHKRFFKLERYIALSSIFNWIIDNNIQVVYFRYAICANPFIINFFKNLKKRGIRIITEIPTFPYDKEITKSSSISYFYLMHKCFRKRLLNYSDKILTFSDDKSIYGLPAINIDNAIDTANYPTKKHLALNDEFHLIGVANISYWHGFDRIIQGIYNYNKGNNDIKIIFHIVGGDSNSIDFRNLVNLVKELNLRNYVIFHGPKTGNELNRLFDISHMAVGSLGRHRSGIHALKALKNNEYACRGIPFMYSENNPLYDNEYYTYKIPADESIINMDAIIGFYNSIDTNPFIIHENFIMKNLTWEHQFNKAGL